MKVIAVKYRFRVPDGSHEVFNLRLDPETMQLVKRAPVMPPVWAKLQFHQCAHCPLDPARHPNCPLAVALIPIAQAFNDVASYSVVELEVTMDDRRLAQSTTAQEAIRSLMGLIIPASGCPHTAFFRPMARFHLPLASAEETVYRATSMYLLAQYFLKQEGRPADLDLKGLVEIYNNVGIVNRAIAHRLRVASKSDSTINALVILDCFTMALPFAIEESLANLRSLFAPFLSRDPETVEATVAE